MRRILGLTTNDSSLSRHALLTARGALESGSPSTLESWGIGYEQESQVLVRKRPQALGSADFFNLLTDLRTQAFVSFSSAQADPRLRAENTEPYRFRSWLAVTTGEFSGVASDSVEIPSLLERGVKGTTSSERVFFRFLHYLRELGVDLNMPVPPVDVVSTALAMTLREVEALDGGASLERGAGILVTNGRALAAGSLGARLAAFRFDGIEVIPEVKPSRSGRRARPVAYEHFRACLIANEVEVEEGWDVIEPREIYAVDENWGLHRGSIDTWLEGEGE